MTNRTPQQWADEQPPAPPTVIVFFGRADQRTRYVKHHGIENRRVILAATALRGMRGVQAPFVIVKAADYPMHSHEAVEVLQEVEDRNALWRYAQTTTAPQAMKDIKQHQQTAPTTSTTPHLDKAFEHLDRADAALERMRAALNAATPTTQDQQEGETRGNASTSE